MKHLGKGVTYQPGKRYQQFSERIALLRERSGLTADKCQVPSSAVTAR